jgi:hypothetical protein
MHLNAPRCYIEISYDAAESEILKALCDGDNEQAKSMKTVLALSSKNQLRFENTLTVTSPISFSAPVVRGGDEDEDDNEEKNKKKKRTSANVSSHFSSPGSNVLVVIHVLTDVSRL